MSLPARTGAAKIAAATMPKKRWRQWEPADPDAESLDEEGSNEVDRRDERWENNPRADDLSRDDNGVVDR